MLASQIWCNCSGRWSETLGPDQTRWSKLSQLLGRIGQTKGGLNSKLHTVCDGDGRPIIMLLSEGQMSDQFWLSDAAWAAIELHLPKNRPGARRVDDRRVIFGILHVLKVGCRWRAVSAEYGPAKTIYNRYHRWSQRRIRQCLFKKMAAVPPELSIDSTHIKAHRSAQGSKEGGRGAKRLVNHAAEEQVKSVVWPMTAADRSRSALTPGNIADIKVAIPLLDVARPTRRLLADKAYDAGSLRGWRERRKVNTFIPSSAARRTPYPLDHKVYRSQKRHRTPVLPN